jgi:hypothetical protein
MIVDREGCEELRKKDREKGRIEEKKKRRRDRCVSKDY